MEIDAAPLSPEQFQQEVDLALQVLRQVEGVSAVKSYPQTYVVKGANNDNDVMCKIKHESLAKPKVINVHINDERVDKLACARKAIAEVAKIVGIAVQYSGGWRRLPRGQADLQIISSVAIQ